MDIPAGRRWLSTALLVAAAYLLIGFAFAWFSDMAATTAMRLMWRRLSWVVCGVGFAAHICYEQFRLRSSLRITAFHVALASALAACGLAVAANVHEWRTASSYRPSIAMALVLWPLLVAVPAFAVAMVAAALLRRWRE